MQQLLLLEFQEGLVKEHHRLPAAVVAVVVTTVVAVAPIKPQVEDQKMVAAEVARAGVLPWCSILAPQTKHCWLWLWAEQVAVVPAPAPLVKAKQLHQVLEDKQPVESAMDKLARIKEDYMPTVAVAAQVDLEVLLVPA
jgi:hypothetical protein